MRRLMAAVLWAAGVSGVGLAAPAMAIEQPGDADAEIAALDQALSAAFDMDYETQKDAKRDAFLAIRARAAEAATRFPADPAKVMQFHEIQGLAAFYAAQHNDPEWNDDEGQKAEIAWLDETVALIAPSLAETGGAVGSHYEFRGAAGQLYALGVRFHDPRLPGWSATRVLANRYRVKAFPDSDFERHLLVEALYDHAVLTKDRALMDEADRVAATIREEDLREAVQDMRAKAVASDAPGA